jgi:hypothetical protein
MSFPVRYSNRKGKPLAERGPSYSPETPVPGCYRIRLTKGGPFVAVRVWLGHPVDPDTGEELTERGLRWQCQLNGAEFVPVEDYWPGCARVPISEAEYARICALSRTMDACHPSYDPKRKIDRLKAPMPF